MDSDRAREIFHTYASAVAYIEVQDPNGDLHIGSAFHVGEGVFVTAGHVVDGREIRKIGITGHASVELTGKEAAAGPYHHRDEKVDVAVFKVREIDSHTPAIRLGSHLDDWLAASDFVLSEAVVLGYPPIPMTSAPVLVGARAEVNALVDLYDAPYAHFILSSMPRGGFSGGVAISEDPIVLGVITRSLLSGDQPTELGFMAVVGVEPIYVCLAEHKLLPDCQAEGWEDFWNTSKLWFSSPGTERSSILSFEPNVEIPGRPLGYPVEGYEKSVRIVADVALFDDGKRVALMISCKDNDKLLRELLTVVRNELADYSLTQSEARPGVQRFDIQPWDTSAGQHGLAAARAVAALLIRHGYVPQQWESPDGTDLHPQ